MPGPRYHVLGLMALKDPRFVPLGAVEIYRVTMPLTVLEEHDPRWSVAWQSVYDLAHYQQEHGTLGTAKMLEMFNLVILPRWWASGDALQDVLNIITALKKLGAKVVYETDDDYTNKHREVHGGGDGAVRLAQACDAITVSTPYLADVMKKETGKPVFVLPNSLDIKLWDRTTERINEPNTLTLGLMGTATHYFDWVVLKDVMPGILADFPHVHLLLGNFHPDYFDELSPTQVHREPGVPYTVYPEMVRACDVVLAPLDPDDGFNLSKSAVKALEGMAAVRELSDGRKGGAAVLATDLPVYNKVVLDGKTGLLVKHTPEAWDRALRRIIQDDGLRATMQFEGNRWVRANRDIHQTWKQWRRAYRRILKTGGERHDRNLTNGRLRRRAAAPKVRHRRGVRHRGA